MVQNLCQSCFWKNTPQNMRLLVLVCTQIFLFRKWKDTGLTVLRDNQKLLLTAPKLAQGQNQGYGYGA